MTRRHLDIWHLAWSGLWRNRRRSSGAVIPTAISVGLVVGLSGLLAHAETDLAARLDTLGADLVVVSASQQTKDGQAVPLPSGASVALASADTVEAIAALAIQPGQHPFRSTHSDPLNASAATSAVLGTSSNLPSTLEVSMVAGRFLTDSDSAMRHRVAVLGSDLAQEFGINTAATDSVVIDHQSFVVIGIVEPIASIPSLNKAAFIPHSVGPALWGTSPEPTQLVLRSTPAAARNLAAGVPWMIGMGTRPRRCRYRSRGSRHQTPRRRHPRHHRRHCRGGDLRGRRVEHCLLPIQRRLPSPRRVRRPPRPWGHPPGHQRRRGRRISHHRRHRRARRPWAGHHRRRHRHQRRHRHPQRASRRGADPAGGRHCAHCRSPTRPQSRSTRTDPRPARNLTSNGVGP